MLRIALALALGFAAVTLTTTTFNANAQEKKDKKDEKKVEAKKFEGTLTCTKCALGESKACGHALIVKEGGKDVKYYLIDKGVKEPYHKECCTSDVKATVTGKPGEREKDGKKEKTIDEPKVEVKK